MAQRPVTKLVRIIRALRRVYGAPILPPPKNAFELILWEKVAYLATDERRAKAFESLRRKIGLTPEAILAAKPALLEKAIAEGGVVGFAERVKHIQDSAAMVIDDFGGSIESGLEGTFAEAKRALQRFYGVGEPGAEKILLFTRSHPVLPLDSNGARTLLRIGYGSDSKNYSKMYRSVRDSASTETKSDFDWLIDAHLLLQRHGREVCKTSAPRCELCVVREECRYFLGSRISPIR